MIAVYISIALLPSISIANIPADADGAHTLQIRAGEHPGYIRIVLEGDASVISKGKVSQSGRDVVVNFPDADLKVKAQKLPVSHKADKDSVIFYSKKSVTIKSFVMQNPSRIVIDLFQDKEADKKPASITIKPEPKKADKIAVEKPPEIAKAPPISEQNIKPDKTESGKNYDEKNLIPEKYKAMWTLLEAGNFYAVLKELPGYKAEDAENLAAFYYIYARASIMSKEYLNALKYLRLAYIYATDDALKELALLTRAEIYMKSGLVYEARADYIIFLRDFPSSIHTDKAHLGLAESLFAISLFQEALEHYEQTDVRPEALFGIANSFQKLGQLEEAKKAYDRAVSADRTYLSRSPETGYLMVENMRMTGDLENAKNQLTILDFGPFKDRADISMGLIAMEESDNEEAVIKFQAAAVSRDERVRVQALFNLALAYLKVDNFKEAASSLEEIRHNHIDSAMYKDTLLVLSKLYRKEGRTRDAVSLLKELVYGKQPPEEAFDELEKIVLETGEKSGQHDIPFVQLWNEVGQWLVDERREDFLLKVANLLRHEEKPFTELCSWLVDNASQDAKGMAAVELADYYVGLGDIDMAEQYITLAKDSMKSGDNVMRIDARIFHAKGDQLAALKKIMLIKDTGKKDIEQLSSIISKINNSGWPSTKDMQSALAFYERKLNESELDAEYYINFADILYANNERDRALKYYRIAYEKNPDNTWAMYRLGRETSAPEAKDLFSRLQKEDNVLGRLAKSKLFELDLMDRIKEVY